MPAGLAADTRIAALFPIFCFGLVSQRYLVSSVHRSSHVFLQSSLVDLGMDYLASGVLLSILLFHGCPSCLKWTLFGFCIAVGRVGACCPANLVYLNLLCAV